MLRVFDQELALCMTSMCWQKCATWLVERINLVLPSSRICSLYLQNVWLNLSKIFGYSLVTFILTRKVQRTLKNGFHKCLGELKESETASSNKSITMQGCMKFTAVTSE